MAAYETSVGGGSRLTALARPKKQGGAAAVPSGIGFRTCFADMLRLEMVEDVRELAGKTLAVDLNAWVDNEMNSFAQEHEKPHLRLVVTTSVHLLKRGVRLIFAYRNTGRKIFECVEVVQALGLPLVKVTDDRTRLLATLVALEQQGHADAVVTNTAEVFLYGATRVFDVPSYFSLRSSGLGERRPAQHEAFSPAATDALRHRRLVAFAALIGCDRAPPHTKRLRWTPNDALKLIAQLGPHDNAIEAAKAWAADKVNETRPDDDDDGGGGGGATPAADDDPLNLAALDPYLHLAEDHVSHLNAHLGVARRPNLHLLINLHFKTPLLGGLDHRPHFANVIAHDVKRLLARLEVLRPDLFPPFQSGQADGASSSPSARHAVSVRPVAFADANPASYATSKADRDELPRNADAVRVLWRSSSGRRSASSIFSTLEDKEAFSYVYPMIKPSNSENSLRFRGYFGL